MIDSSWQDDQVSFFDPNHNPLVVLVQAVVDLFVSVHVLSEEVLHLILIVLQFVRTYLNKILQKATIIWSAHHT
jgi:hypothetical protein